MTHKNKIIKIVTLTVLAFAVLLTSGVTLAVNVLSNSQSGSITTANLRLTSSVKNVRVYTAVAAADGDANVFEDNDGNRYKYQQCNAQSSDGKILFGDRSGGVTLGEKSVELQNVMPGDRVDFDIEVNSASSIAFDYRAELFVDASKGQTLLNQLDFSAGNLGLTRKDVTENVHGEGELSQAVLTDFTQWQKVSSSKTHVDKVRVSVSLPITATKGQGESVKLYYVVRGTQNTVVQDDVASVVAPNGQTLGFAKLADAVKYAEENGVSNVSVIGSTVLEEGSVAVNKPINFVGKVNSNGTYPLLNGARITVANGASATFTNVHFGGASCVDVTNAMGLTLNNCVADVNPEKYFDTVTREYVADRAFVVSGTSSTPVKLNLKSNRIVLRSGGAALSLRSPLSNGSAIADNVFGSNEYRLNGTAAMVFNGAVNLDSDSVRPIVTAVNNKLFADTAFCLGSGANQVYYTVVSADNVAYGVQAGQFVKGELADGATRAAFTDFGSKIGNAALTRSDVSVDALMFAVVNARLNEYNLITSGEAALSDGVTAQQFAYYTAGDTVADNAITLYKNGVLYAHSVGGQIVEVDAQA